MTKILTFPGLGLEFNMDPVAFRIFGWPIHWYGIIIAVGFLLAVWYGLRRAPGFGVDPDKLIDLLFIDVPVSIIGTRLYYVIFNSSLYVRPDGSFDFGAALAIWDGGLAIYGGLITAVATGLIYCIVRKQSFWDYADCAAFGFPIGQLVGRWGNFVNVEAFGSVTTVPWRMAGENVANYMLQTGQADTGVYREIVDGTLGVHPTFLYESLWNLLCVVLLILFVKKKGRRFSGQPFLFYVVWYGLGRAAIEGLRTDSLYLFNTPIRTSQLVGLVTAAAAIAVTAYFWKHAGPATPPLRKEVPPEPPSETEADVEDKSAEDE